ncbi:hypothetical protein L596_026804 [Steinernema carpocapsae]|uniref:G-protein coupled receptors family 1 profile domain-containing protein n=1 Tax=Steinernema carpocapsae TaxID=34508 RepID=A0A4U5M2K8_STECR|nr:hypothetical protein L596_026804 [Steinernema carpocapsae]
MGNGLIVLATLTQKSLHNPCNILIGIQAVSDIIMQISHIFYVYSAWNELLVSFYTCYYVNFIFISCNDFSILMVFFISLDRFIASKEPILHKNINHKYYIAGILLICFCYCAIFKYLMFTSLTDEMTMCLIAQSVTGSTTMVWLVASSVLNVGVILIYSFLVRSFKSSESEYRTINKSLKTMITVHVFGWFLTMAGGIFLSMTAPTLRVFSAMEATGGIAANINLAAPFFIYYFRSTLYRKAFQKVFRRMGFKRRTNQIMTTA